MSAFQGLLEPEPDCPGLTWKKRWEFSCCPWGFASVPCNPREVPLGLWCSWPFCHMGLHRNSCFSLCKTTPLGRLYPFSFLRIGVSILSTCISWKPGVSSLNTDSSSGEMSCGVNNWVFEKPWDRLSHLCASRWVTGPWWLVYDSGVWDVEVGSGPCVPSSLLVGSRRRHSSAVALATS